MSYGIRGGEIIDVNKINRWIKSYNSLARYQVSVSARIGADFDPSTDVAKYWIRLSNSYYRDAIVVVSVHYIKATDSNTWVHPTIEKIYNFAGVGQVVTLQNTRTSAFPAVDTNYQWLILSSEYAPPSSGDDWYEFEIIPGYIANEKDMVESNCKNIMLIQVRDGMSQLAQKKRGDTIWATENNAIQDFLDYDIYFSTYRDNIPKPYWRAGTANNFFVENAEFVVQQIGALPIFPELARPKELDGGFVTEYEYVPFPFMFDVQTKTGYKVQSALYPISLARELGKYTATNILASAMKIKNWPTPTINALSADRAFSSGSLVQIARNFDENACINEIFQGSFVRNSISRDYRLTSFFKDNTQDYSPPTSNKITILNYSDEPVFVDFLL